MVSVVLSTPPKAYNGGGFQIGVEWDYKTLWIAPDINLRVYQDGNLVVNEQYNGRSSGSKTFQLQAPDLPTRSTVVKVITSNTGVIDAGLTCDDQRIVNLVDPASDGGNSEWSTDDDDTEEKADYSKYIAIGIVGIIIIGIVYVTIGGKFKGLM